MEPEILVGIMFSSRIPFALHESYYYINGEQREDVMGEGMVEIMEDGKFMLTLGAKKQFIDLPITLTPSDGTNCSFELKDVTIGINFHWERKENQHFTGSLRIIKENNHLTAINILPLEDYLKSVISSEMSATSSEELLKAHAVISRSWLMAQMDKKESLMKKGQPSEKTENTNEHIRWYDREDHQNFDVCADDHCQRYQGITKASTLAVEQAIQNTKGQVLTHHGAICDARYSKCCGGITELFENVWEPIHHPYLTKVIDHSQHPMGYDVNLDTEEKAHMWITNFPEAFCNSKDREVLSQVLNDYDQETLDFYRWEKVYSQNEIKEMLKNRIGIYVGDVLNLIPMERGASGRLIKLLIEGSERNIVIGKELEIRKAFSPSHLYSSAFVIAISDIRKGVPQKFSFTGAGWGHGVGLCQIGAAVMGARGYSYKNILEHYFKGAALEKRY